MSSEEIQKEISVDKLLKRLTEKDVRKKERRLLYRKIARLEKKPEVVGSNPT